MSLLDRTYDLISRGRSANRPLSIPTGYPKYDKLLYGIRQGTYILLGGETGTGKSPFIRSTYVDTPYEQYKTINDANRLDLQFVDFSLEIQAEHNMVAMISRRAFKEYGMVLSVPKILGWKEEDPLTDREAAVVEEIREYFEEFQSKVVTVDRETTPDLFHDVLMGVALKHGSFERPATNISDCEGYVPNNPNLFVIVLLDTLNLTNGDLEGIKGAMDKTSRTAVWFRNKCNFVIIFVQQFNSDMNAVDRYAKKSGVIKTPVLKDFMDSTRPTKDCTIALGLYSPMRHYDPEDPVLFKGYDITKLGEWLCSIHVMKNRYGPPNAFIPLKMDGELGMFTQLPNAPMTDEQYAEATRH